MDHKVCPECGARLAPGAERCDLCGAPVEVAEPGGEQSPTSAVERGDIPEPKTEGGVLDGVYCNACGAKNPPGSNFCSRCGTRLQSAAVAAAGPTAPSGSDRASDEDATSSSSQRALNRHVGMLVGLAVLVVVALYMITVISKQRTPSQAEATAAAPAEARAASIIQEHEALPISEAFRPQVDSLEAVIDESGVEEGIPARRRLVDFLIGIGRIDRAAIEQQRVARITEQAEDWKKAGNLLFDWMETSEPEAKSQIALLTIEAYRQVLQENPGDLDVRADLGWAYQYDPQNPMEAIQQTNLVLEEDPDHLKANYNKGVFLLRINRLEQAIEQFERVKSIAGAESPYYRQADMWIETIRQSQAEREAS